MHIKQALVTLLMFLFMCANTYAIFPGFTYTKQIRYASCEKIINGNSSSLEQIENLTEAFTCELKNNLNEYCACIHGRGEFNEILTGPGMFFSVENEKMIYEMNKDDRLKEIVHYLEFVTRTPENDANNCFNAKKIQDPKLKKLVEKSQKKFNAQYITAQIFNDKNRSKASKKLAKLFHDSGVRFKGRYIKDGILNINKAKDICADLEMLASERKKYQQPRRIQPRKTFFRQTKDFYLENQNKLYTSHNPNEDFLDSLSSSQKTYTQVKFCFDYFRTAIQQKKDTEAEKKGKESNRYDKLDSLFRSIFLRDSLANKCLRKEKNLSNIDKCFVGNQNGSRHEQMRYNRNKSIEDALESADKEISNYIASITVPKKNMHNIIVETLIAEDEESYNEDEDYQNFLRILDSDAAEEEVFTFLDLTRREQSLLMQKYNLDGDDIFSNSESHDTGDDISINNLFKKKPNIPNKEIIPANNTITIPPEIRTSFQQLQPIQRAPIIETIQDMNKRVTPIKASTYKKIVPIENDTFIDEVDKTTHEIGSLKNEIQGLKDKISVEKLERLQEQAQKIKNDIKETKQKRTQKVTRSNLPSSNNASTPISTVNTSIGNAQSTNTKNKVSPETITIVPNNQFAAILPRVLYNKENNQVNYDNVAKTVLENKAAIDMPTFLSAKNISNFDNIVDNLGVNKSDDIIVKNGEKYLLYRPVFKDGKIVDYEELKELSDDDIKETQYAATKIVTEEGLKELSQLEEQIEFIHADLLKLLNVKR